MNGTDPRIEIFKPFGEAFELMKKILFQPFDLTKWLVMGFAAFLANLSGGLHFNVPTNWEHQNWRPWSRQDWNSAIHRLPDWALQAGVIAVICVMLVAFILVFMWLGARGRFIFTDCIVKNRGAIVAPWREFRKEGNSLFLFTLLISLVLILVVAVFAVVLFVPLFFSGRDSSRFQTVLTISAAVLFGMVVFVFAMAWFLVAQFMVAVMYRRRSRAREAFGIITSLVSRYPGEFLLYCLFLIVLVLATAMVGCVAICATCCIAAIPYVGTVILLPIFVLLRAFSFCFLRQFGPDYDVWQAIPQPEPPPTNPEPPPTPPPLPA